MLAAITTTGGKIDSRGRIRTSMNLLTSVFVQHLNFVLLGSSHLLNPITAGDASDEENIGLICRNIF